MTLIFFIIAGIVWSLPIQYWIIGLLCFILEPKK